MNRKLHNTVTALFATSGLLALSLVAGHPAPVSQASPSGAQVARIEAAALTGQATALEQALDQADDPAPHPVHRARRGRQSVAMPFFSFFPKG